MLWITDKSAASFDAFISASSSLACANEAKRAGTRLRCFGEHPSCPANSYQMPPYCSLTESPAMRQARL